MSSSTDRIEKTTTLRAPVERVWQAITDAQRFGAWFGMEIDGAFEAGKQVTGRIVPTQVDAEVAKLQEPHKGMALSLKVERVEAMRHFSFRWWPKGGEPGTLVTFALEEVPGGTKLTITEAGFDQLPAGFAQRARPSSDSGWALQLGNIEKYLAR